MNERFFEDFAIGQIFASTRRLRVAKDEIIAFAKQFDPQPFHLDEQAARNSIFGGLVASGWYTAALTMRLIAESEFRSAAGTPGLGFDELRWPVPVRPGDELRIESKVLDVRLSKSRPNQGLMKMRILILNQQGQVVQELVANELVPRRPTGEKRSDGKCVMSFDDIVDHSCYAWNTLIEQPGKIMSIAHRDWAIVGHSL